MKINVRGIIGILFIAVMIIICHFYRNWDIPWLFVIISTGSFFGILTAWTIEREESRKKNDYIHYLSPLLYFSFILCTISLLINFQGFFSWTLVLISCILIGFTAPTLLFSWALVGHSKIKPNIYGFFGIISLMFMGAMIYLQCDFNYDKDDYIGIGNSTYAMPEYAHHMEDEFYDYKDSIYHCDSIPRVIDFEHLKNLNEVAEFDGIDVDEMRRDHLIHGVAFNPSLPWFFIIFSTIVFWIYLFFLSIRNIKDREYRKTAHEKLVSPPGIDLTEFEDLDIRHMISTYLTYFLCSLSLAISVTGFWTWTGIFILCISIGVGLPFLLIRKSSS